MKYCVLIFSFGFYQIVANAQVNFYPLPETCDFLYTSKNGSLLLGTPNGVYHHTGSLDVHKSDLRYLRNRNIQSTFYPGKKTDVWFCTYDKIIRLNASNGNLNEYSLTLNGETLNDNYHVFWVDTIKKIIWVRQKDKVLLYDINKNSSTLLCSSIDGYRILRHEEKDLIYLFSYFHAESPTIVKVNKTPIRNPIVTYWKNWPKETMAMDIVPFDNNELIIGTTKGLMLGNIAAEIVRPLFFKQLSSGIKAIGKQRHNEWIISTGDSLHLLIFNGKKFELKKFPFTGINHPVHRIYNSPDNTIFLASNGNGIYYYNPDKIKFRDWNYTAFNEIENQTYSADRLKNISSSSDINSGKPYAFNEECEIFCNSGYKASRIVSDNKSSIISHPNSSILFRYYQPGDGKLYGNFMNAGLFEYVNGTWQKVNYPEDLSWEFNYYFPINDSLSLASIDMSKLVMWNPERHQQIMWQMVFTGDIYNQYYDKKNNQLFLATEQGLVKFNITTKQFELIKDKHENSCLCVLADRTGKIWYSSQSGIAQYDPNLQIHRYYYSSDGVSTEKYIERKCLALTQDSLLFFHAKGATLVVPSQIKTINAPAQIFVSGLKINDLEYPAGDTLNYCTEYNLPYENNTFSFETTVIDWSDPAHTNLRYKLHNYDDAWVQPDRNNILIRYANLPPGKYTLFLQGANSDGIWNNKIRTIAINVIPPFYLTWWFLTLVAISSILFIYWIIKTYYKRQLARKNQLLREQSLIIEKQQAVENERTRIASEMHDDLGSGLTTIRYLSDKALIQAKDSEEATQIKKIADHSNTLVRNMSEIIWAMNSRFDNTENLIGYLRRYASEYLDERQMPFTFESNVTNEMVSIGGEKRRNIFLVFKELLHNSVKYSNAKSISILIQTTDNFIIRISEIGGKGFDPELSIEKGNGLFNCRKRLKSIGGQIAFEKTGDAMNIIITVPINVPNLA